MPEHLGLVEAPTLPAVWAAVLAEQLTVRLARGTEVAPRVAAQYSTSVTGLVSAANATDIVTLLGAPGRRLTLRRVWIGGTATAITPTFSLLRRTQPTTGGTNATMAIVPHRSAGPLPGALALSYTANPTVPTGGLVLRNQKVSLAATAANQASLAPIWDWSGWGQEGPTLLGGEQFALNLNATSITGPLLDIWIEFAEEQV